MSKRFKYDLSNLGLLLYKNVLRPLNEAKLNV